MMNRRLSSAELDEILAAKAETAQKLNLDDEAADLKQLFVTLRENSAEAAAHHRALTVRKPAQTSSAFGMHSRVAWGLCAAALVVSVAVPVERHHKRLVMQEQTMVRDEAKRIRQSEQAMDEALLLNVESDLSSSVPRPLQPLSVKLVSESTDSTKGTNE